MLIPSDQEVEEQRACMSPSTLYNFLDLAKPFSAPQTALKLPRLFQPPEIQKRNGTGLPLSCGGSGSLATTKPPRATPLTPVLSVSGMPELAD